MKWSFEEKQIFEVTPRRTDGSINNMEIMCESSEALYKGGFSGVKSYLMILIKKNEIE